MAGIARILPSLPDGSWESSPHLAFVSMRCTRSVHPVHIAFFPMIVFYGGSPWVFVGGVGEPVGCCVPGNLHGTLAQPVRLRYSLGVRYPRDWWGLTVL